MAASTSLEGHKYIILNAGRNFLEEYKFYSHMILIL